MKKSPAWGDTGTQRLPTYFILLHPARHPAFHVWNKFYGTMPIDTVQNHISFARVLTGMDLL